MAAALQSAADAGEVMRYVGAVDVASGSCSVSLSRCVGVGALLFWNQYTSSTLHSIGDGLCDIWTLGLIVTCLANTGHAVTGLQHSPMQYMLIQQLHLSDDCACTCTVHVPSW